MSTRTITLVTIGFILSGLGACRQAAPPAEAQTTPLAVKLQAVKSSAIADTSEYIANLESRQSVTLQPRVEGQVSQISVRAGDEVRAGTLLMQIDPARQQASVNSFNAATAGARADLENARATLKNYQAERLERQANLKLNQTEYDRYRVLYRDGAVSRQTLDTYTNRLEVAKAGMGTIEAQIESQQAAIARATQAVQQSQSNTQAQAVQLQYFSITAPFSGRVGNIPVKVGDFVNTSARLLTLTQNNQLEVNVSIPIERAAQLRLGMPIEVLDREGQTVGTSRVFFIAPNTTNAAQSVLVKSLFDNSKGQLRADQFVRARAIWDKSTGISVPTTAISRVAGQEFVFVAEKNQSGLVARQRAVKLGNIEGNNYQVMSGLKAGDRIAVSGLLQLSDGAAIAPQS
ncbi:MAG: Multidrug resistance protein MdtA [Chroococcidiopsis cubana SAG 39.79]|uniref:Hemolysin D n=1 Tax=Chroococcidiopsis cubana SAG 39.79 TaxID=388085 RepID=A0AB37UBN2_9CYAN|nr:efflux RND transporter periplasmic adaptor subunit [Chroococcidiopsis cubana]MDZ4872150.1 Multidrug resistance protein MdtA [Chroococcidiopsis cubana SAG 39.79]PSB54479.1 efflux transporter periplasmic adaptor subunit [Chroococcidiopsis cubana CCALA 043]RUT04137.1 hemolysin D [Chroococcidiopsis cubana SAG 39.79]